MNLVEGFHDDLQMVLQRLYKVTLPLYIHGRFGIGKTDAVKQFAAERAKELGLEYSEDFNDINDEKKFMCLPFILHQYEPAELKGLPFPNANRDKTIYLPVGLLPIKGQGVIFFDEINLAPPMMQNNAYQIIEDRRLGFYSVPKGYMSIGAGNLMDDMGNTFENPMPLNNRFLHFLLKPPTVDDTEEVILGENGENVVKVHKGWVSAYALPRKLDHRIINYLKYKQQDLNMFKPEENNGDIAVGSPRTWRKAADAINGIPSTDHLFIEKLVGMAVGRATGQEFVAWLRLSEKHDIADYYKTGKISNKPNEIDQLYSLMSALVGYYIEHKMTGENAVQLLKLSRQFNKEHQVMILSQVKNHDEDFFRKKIKDNAPKELNNFANDIFKLLVN